MAQRRPRARGEATGSQEGSRWINERPTGDELAGWFAENVKLHKGLNHADYVQGITLIPQKEKPKVVANGNVVDGPERLVYIPYAKVETRIAYFWDYIDSLEDVVGSILPGRVAKLRGEHMTNENLPDGFFRYPVPGADGRATLYLGCTMQVHVQKRSLMKGDEGTPVMRPPAGTKTVPMLGRYGPDDNAFMKAETGAVGRALGMAGMLVIPGSGVATAEDMQEMLSRDAGSAPSGELPASLPDAEAVDPREQVVAMLDELQGDFPDAHQAIQDWARSRKLNLNEIGEAQLRGVVRKLDKTLAEAKENQQGPPPAPEPSPEDEA